MAGEEKAAATQPKPKAEAKKSPTDGKVAIKDLAKELHMEPRQVRISLRALGYKARGAEGSQGVYAWDPKDPALTKVRKDLKERKATKEEAEKQEATAAKK